MTKVARFYACFRRPLLSFCLVKGVELLESEFNALLKTELEGRLPGCVIIKQDPNTSFQGVPDHLVLYENKWALLEAKRGRKAKQRPNQEYYIHRFDEMSFAAFINPDNYLEVLDDLQQAFRPGR